MTIIKKLYLYILITIILVSLFPTSVKADNIKVLDFNVGSLLYSNYSKNPYISFETGQTYGIKLTVDSSTTRSIGLNMNPDFTFSSKDPSIVSVDKTSGILKGNKIGTTDVVISYPGLKKIIINVTILPTLSGETAENDHNSIKAIEALSKEKIKSDNLIDYYNNLNNLKYSTMTKKDHFINIPNDYQIGQMWNKLGKYLSNQKAIFNCPDPIKVSEITKITKDTLTVKLNRKITEADLVAYANAYAMNCTSDMKLKVGLCIYKGTKNPLDKSNKQIDIIESTVGLKDNIINIKLSNKIKYNESYRVGFYYSDEYGNYITDGLAFTSK